MLYQDATQTCAHLTYCLSAASSFPNSLQKTHRRDQVKDVWILPQIFWYEFHPLGKSLPLHKSSFSLQNHWTWKDGQEVQSNLRVPSDTAWDSCFALSIVLTPGQDLLYPARPATKTPTSTIKAQGSTHLSPGLPAHDISPHCRNPAQPPDLQGCNSISMCNSENYS